MSSSVARSSPQRLPSNRFLLQAASHAFLLRQHPRTLSLLTQLFAQLPPAQAVWMAGETLSMKDSAREDVRRQAVVLWITCLVCLVAAGLDADAPTPSFLGTLSGDGRTDEALRTQDSDLLLRAIVSRTTSVYSPPPPHPRRSSSARRTSSPGVPAASLLPPQVVQTLLLAAQRLNVPSSTASSLVLAPFLASISLSLQHRLAGLSRDRETEEDFGQRDATAGGWLGKVLDGYEGVVETWTLHILGQDWSKVDEALLFVRQDMVLGRARKNYLIGQLEQLSRPSHLFPNRPPSPGLSDTASSSSSLSSVVTTTPDNYLPTLAKGKERASSLALSPPPEAHPTLIPAQRRSGRFAEHVSSIHRFISPRPTRPSSSLTLPSIHSDEPTTKTLAVLPSSPLRSLSVILKRYLPSIRLPALLVFLLSLVVSFVQRRRALTSSWVQGVDVGEDVRRRLTRGLLGW